jgi:phytanoyl-CoA hydroxylase
LIELIFKVLKNGVCHEHILMNHTVYTPCFFAGANNTNRFRKAISVHYSSANSHYIDVRGTSQESIAKEVENVAEKRGLNNVPFEMIWHMKSRLVRGREGKL